MKKLFSLLFIGLLITSCSSEETEVTEKQKPNLIKLEIKQFNTGKLSGKTISEYNNNKIAFSSYYDENNQLTNTSEWNYSNNNDLSSIKRYLPSGILSSELNITYDNSNRITQTIDQKEDGSSFTITNFTHNSDNTINSHTNKSGDISTKIFEINDNGVIDKEIVNGEVRVSVEYDDFTPISSTSLSRTFNYTYQENGFLPYTFETNTINVVLYSNYLDQALGSLTSKLITEITSNSSIEKFIYTLNENNFPITMENYINGQLNKKFDYTYE